MMVIFKAANVRNKIIPRGETKSVPKMGHESILNEATKFSDNFYNSKIEQRYAPK